MDAPQPELTIDWHHYGYRVIRIFVQDPLDQATRERLMATAVTFRDTPDVASLRRQVEGIAQETGLISTFADKPDHSDPLASG